MIKNVSIKNFKSIVAQHFRGLPPIVGIWGKNGTGKSSFLQAIVWTAKNSGNFDMHGLKLGDFNNVVFGRKRSTACEVKITDYSNKEIRLAMGGNVQTSIGGPTLSEIRYFPPWRHISERQAIVSNVITSDLGFQAQNTHTFLHWFLHELVGRIARGDNEAKITYERLNYWSEKIGYGKLLDNLIGKNAVMGTYEDPTFKIEIPLVDGGFGGNSFLPILLECYKFRDGIILIEEPEISLHPGAQGDVWEFMMEMVEKRKHQIIFTSHSPYLARKIARTLSEGKFKTCVHVYYTSRTKEKGTEFELIPSEEIIRRFSEYWGDDIFPELRGR